VVPVENNVPPPRVVPVANNVHRLRTKEQLCDYLHRAAGHPVNSFQAIRVFAVRITPIFTSKIRALNILKMTPLLRSDVMLS
jgi:hypothetical protein